MVKVPPVADDLVGWSAPTATKAPESSSTASQEPSTARSAREKVYTYVDGDVYAVPVGLGAPLRIILQPGERIHNLVGGDRSPSPDGQEGAQPWEVKEGLTGSELTVRPLVFVTVTKPGLSTGITITTTRRVYELVIRSVAKTPVRSVRWTYPDKDSIFAKALELSPLPDPTQPQRYHVPYTIETSTPAPAWSMGLHAVDDGSKTYLIFPPTVTTMDAPLVRLIGSNGPELVNARQVGSVLVLDRLINRAELRLGTGPRAELVTIQREAPVTIQCPGEPRCPVWPSQQVRRPE
jgi:type IV secretory pathway VirB9-like protein